MPTNFPGGVSANGAPLGGTPGKVFYVGNRSGLPASNGADPLHPFSTLNGALAKCTSGRGDVVKILPGHVESISSADQMTNLVADVTIEGVSDARGRKPILRWTAAGSTFLLDVAGVVLKNLRLQMAGDPSSSTALSVAAPMTISAASCSILDCEIQVGVDADQLATAAITTTAAADDLTIDGCVVFGAITSEVTTVFQFVGADRLKFTNNHVMAALATDTDGLLQFATTASTNVVIKDNILHANGVGNTVCIQMSANLVNTGWIVRNFCRNMTDASVAWIITTGTGVDVQLMDNYGVNNANERGLAIGTASA